MKRITDQREAVLAELTDPPGLTSLEAPDSALHPRYDYKINSFVVLLCENEETCLKFFSGLERFWKHIAQTWGMFLISLYIGTVFMGWRICSRQGTGHCSHRRLTMGNMDSRVQTYGWT